MRWFTKPSWIRSCIKFMWEHRVSISPFGANLPILRLRDKNIMEAFAVFIDDTPTPQQLNRCQMEKHMMWLSDIFSEDGKGNL